MMYFSNFPTEKFTCYNHIKGQPISWFEQTVSIHTSYHENGMLLQKHTYLEWI